MRALFLHSYSVVVECGANCSSIPLWGLLSADMRFSNTCAYIWAVVLLFVSHAFYISVFRPIFSSLIFEVGLVWRYLIRW